MHVALQHFVPYRFHLAFTVRYCGNIGQAHTVEDFYLLGRFDVRLPSVLIALV